MASNIAIQISANTQQAVAGIQSVNQKLDQMQKESESVSAKFQRLTSITGGATIVLNAVGKAIQAVAEAASACVTAYSAQEQAERRLQTVLTATQDAVGMSASELYNLADSLSKVTSYTDQEIIAAEQMLAATRKIGRDIMPEATKAVLDMAAATGDDAAGAAHDLAQALSDPAGEIESLKEKGIQLTEKQAENIKKVQEQNGLYQAQKLLLKEVSETYGGMAEAIASTDTGKLQQISNVWNDIKEGLGEGLLNSIGPALDWIYERLNDIADWIDNQNQTAKNTATAEEIRKQGLTDLADVSDEALSYVIADSPYARWLNEYKSLEPDASESDIANATLAQIHGTQRFTREDMLSYNAAVSERDRRAREAARNQQRVLNGITGSLSVASPSVDSWQENLITPYADAFLSSGKQYASERARETSLNERRTASSNALGSFIDKYGSLSSSYQVSGIEDAIRASQSWMAEVDPDSDAYNQLKEINEALYEQRDALLNTGDAAATWQDELKASLPDIVSSLTSIGSSIADIFSNMADSAEAELQRIEEKWDEYFDELDEKQGRQTDSLNAMLASGDVSYEEYIDAMNKLDESRNEAQAKATKEKEDAQKKANELGEAAFVANQVNSIAEATMNVAQGVTKAIAQGGVAGIVTGALVSAAGAAQIAAIASQKYTPMAAGGIVTSPTHALVGEGGSPEAILPLNDQTMDKFGIGGTSGGVINISISIGAVYSKEELADEIFHGIERAQRTGALPSWRYA